ncbi:DUF4244 domain-containing protein [Streptomyces sp. NPDC020412]|uniref:DUF4244 domain-containing protein n=1 Tax=Streptomyces sp. NPDC020412 TaxID=3365073 RepID=UPI003789CAFC
MNKAILIKAIRRRPFPRRHGDSGMVTSEYAMATMAACGFAALLYELVTSGWASNALKSLIGRALDGQF